MVEPKLSRQSDADRGQVGIETLIIFIAMILVAAVAAGVLINTAGFLQNKASATSQESQKQVSNQVIVVSATGNVNNTSDANVPQAINQTTLTVMQSPGSDAIDLEASTVALIGPNGEATLTFNETHAHNTSGHFNVTPEKDPDDSLPVLNQKGDRFDIKIYLNSSSAGSGEFSNVPQEPLLTGEELTLKIVTQSGSQYVYVATVPDTLASHDTGEAVAL
jgi:flagellin FlaB